ncbi:MAG: hypothetical protein JWO05_1070 [Gemmatimonadetes bacterium]|nr:hypothetical protein [Gemmatimonadota bacterium]
MNFGTAAIAMERLASNGLRGNLGSSFIDSNAAELASLFRRTVSLSERRASGAFFTAPGLAAQMARGVPSTATVCDPTCGIGDLLLSHVRRLPVERSLDETLDEWGERISGFELHGHLLRVARARIALAAIARFERLRKKPGRSTRLLKELFPSLIVGDGRDSGPAIRNATHVWLNPPYNRVQAPPECTWSSGLVSQAALFVESTLLHSRAGTSLTAILPDVLRSGSRYQRWRMRIEELARVQSVEIAGLFDQHTHVDVFVLRATRLAVLKREPGAGMWTAVVSNATVGSLVQISVGPVVPYREPNLGPWRPYVDVKSCPRDGVLLDSLASRRFRGRVFEPPLVLIRRTSSPHDKHRIVSTLVTDSRSLAVENHLLVLEPYDGTVATCMAVLDVLRSERTNTWLNERIRCRHLTVEAVRDIPLR